MRCPACAVVPQAAYLANGSSQQHHQVGHYYYLLLLLVFLGSLELSVNSLTLGNILVDLYVRDSIELATAPTVQPLKFHNPEQFKIIVPVHQHWHSGCQTAQSSISKSVVCSTWCILQCLVAWCRWWYNWMILDFVSCQCQCNGQVSDKHNPNQIYCRRIKSKALNGTAVNQLVGWKGPLKHKSIM